MKKKTKQKQEPKQTKSAPAAKPAKALKRKRDEEQAVQQKTNWSLTDALAFANTLANHGWTREANADSASSCIYALCRLLKDGGNAAAMREALLRCEAISCLPEIREQQCVRDMRNIITAALSAPPKNCDLYNTPEESIRMFETYIRESGKVGFINPFTEVVKWLFAPSAERKGE